MTHPFLDSSLSHAKSCLAEARLAQMNVETWVKWLYRPPTKDITTEIAYLAVCRFHQDRAMFLRQALASRAKWKALRRDITARAVAKTDPPPPSDVCMVAGE